MKVVELVFFELKEGVSEKDFLLASENFEKNFVESQKGLFSRNLIKSENNLWADMVVWETMNDAMKAGKKIGSEDASKNYMTFLNQTSIKVNHMSIIQ